MCIDSWSPHTSLSRWLLLPQGSRRGKRWSHSPLPPAFSAFLTRNTMLPQGISCGVWPPGALGVCRLPRICRRAPGMSVRLTQTRTPCEVNNGQPPTASKKCSTARPHRGQRSHPALLEGWAGSCGRFQFKLVLNVSVERCAEKAGKSPVDFLSYSLLFRALSNFLKNVLKFS